MWGLGLRQYTCQIVMQLSYSKVREDRNRMCSKSAKVHLILISRLVKMRPHNLSDFLDVKQEVSEKLPQR